jgi:hypothetical protein
MSSDRFQQQIDTIVEQQAKFSEDMLMLKDALLSLANIVEGLAEQGKETDARLNTLITLFERHITEDHKGDGR